MASIAQLVAWALKVKNQTQPEGNTETLVGGLFEAIVGFLQDLSNRIANMIIGWYWQEPVDTVNKLSSTYPSPKLGWAVLVKDKNLVYVWNGSAWTNTGITSFPTDAITPNTLSQTLGNSITKVPSEKAVGDAMIPLKNASDRLNETVYGGIKDVTPSAWVLGYINTSGEFVESTSYRVSDFIAVTPGQKYRASLSGSQNTFVISGYSSNIQSNFVSSSINIIGTTLNPGNVNFYEFIIPIGVNYIRLGKHSATDMSVIYLWLTTNASIGGLVSKVETIIPLADDIPILQDTLFGGGGVIEDLTGQLAPWTTGHISTAGLLVTPSSYQVSSFIPVQAGKKYRFKASGSVNVFLISGYSSNNQSSFVASTINIPGTSVPREEVVIIPSAVNYIRLCNHPGFPVSDVYLKEVDSVTERGLVDRVDVLEEKVSNDSTEFRLKRCAVFSIIADDCFSSDPAALDIANEYNIPLSFAVQTSQIGTNGIDFYKDAYKNGSSILSHTINHQISETEITESKRILKNYGFPTNGYISPGGVGVTPPDLLTVIERYYGYANPIPNTTTVIPFDATFISKFDHNVNPYRLTRIGLESWNAGFPDCSKIKELIDFAIDNNLLVLMYTHELPSHYKNSDETSVLSLDNFRAICAYLADKRDNYYCRVLNTDQAVREYYGYKDY